MKRVAATLVAVALVLMGGWWFFLRPPEQLLVTADGPCFVGPWEGLLVADPRTGTAIVTGDRVQSLVWVTGYTGRRVGSEIEVIDRQGEVVATTGQHVVLMGGGLDGLPGFLVCGVESSAD